MAELIQNSLKPPMKQLYEVFKNKLCLITSDNRKVMFTVILAVILKSQYGTIEWFGLEGTLKII